MGVGGYCGPLTITRDYADLAIQVNQHALLANS